MELFTKSNNLWNKEIVQFIIICLLSLYTTSTHGSTILPKIKNLYPMVKPMVNYTDIGWEYIPFNNSKVSHIVTYSMGLIGFITILVYSYINKTKDLAHFLNIVIITQFIYIISIIVTRLPDTAQDHIKCGEPGIYGVANCSQKIPSGHTMKLVITAYFLSKLFPKFTPLFVILLIIGIYFVISGRLHRTIDVVMGVIVASLLCIARPEGKIYSEYLALSLLLIHILLLFGLHRMNQKRLKAKKIVSNKITINDIEGAALDAVA